MIKNMTVEELFEQFEEVDQTGKVPALLKSFAIINYTYRVKEYSYIKGLKDVISVFIQMMTCLKRTRREVSINADVPLLTFISERPHLYKMNDRLAAEFKNGCNRAYFFSAKRNVSSKDEAIAMSKLQHAILCATVRENFPIIIKACKIFRRFLKRNNLSSSHFLPFCVHLIRQFAAYGTYLKVFERSKVPFIVCEYDQSNQGAALVLAARQLGIPTFTQTHGLLNSKFGYYPLVADHIFVWGNYHKELLLDWDLKESQVHVTGAIQFERFQLESTKDTGIIERQGLSERVITFPANTMHKQAKEALVEFIKALAAILPTNWTVILRPKTSEDKNDYLKLFKETKNLKVLANIDLDISDLMAITDLVVVWNSAFAIDALINKIKTVHVSLKNIICEGEVPCLVERGLIPCFDNEISLLEYIRDLSCIRGERLELSDVRYRHFKNEYLVRIGSEAAAEMVLKLKALS